MLYWSPDRGQRWKSEIVDILFIFKLTVLIYSSTFQLNENGNAIVH